MEMLGLLVAAASAPGMEGALRMENAAAAGFQYVQEHPHAFHMFVRDVTDPEISERQEALRRSAVTAMADVMEMEPPETRAGMTRQHTEQLAEMVVGGLLRAGRLVAAQPGLPPRRSWCARCCSSCGSASAACRTASAGS